MATKLTENMYDKSDKYNLSKHKNKSTYMSCGACDLVLPAVVASLDLIISSLSKLLLVDFNMYATASQCTAFFAHTIRSRVAD